MPRNLYVIYDGYAEYPIQAATDAAALKQARRWLHTHAGGYTINMSTASISRSLLPGSRFLAYLKDIDAAIRQPPEHAGRGHG
ncbi:hypothetical protein EH165_09450 [Nakamurella antarctica]|uniref:Uncharacterized protein n=1 Tax=Nakamurella antarctica TaxID=1902245 RepID=A0A3G8ZM71_9ACTN|nr:hypothetical protein [Nakamurella antarctica]AZI58330.1 hypothetical protein EH165_09450 [Nakamurella antarctica]